MRISLLQAKEALQKSQVVAIPTETVWGLAAPLGDEKAIQQIFDLKKRPQENPLIIHISDFNDLKEYILDPLPPHTLDLAKAFWPGPLTLVLPCRQEQIPSIARANLPSAGFRVPRTKATRELLQQVGPLVAPSANLSGRPSSTTVEHIEEDFGTAFPCLETDELCECGIESTILVFQENKWQVGRLGALSIESITREIGYTPTSLSHKEKPICPGQKFRHYAPQAQLTLSRKPWQVEWHSHFDAILGFQDRVYQQAKQVIPLGFSYSPTSAEKALYKALRELDRRKIQRAWVDAAISFSPEWEPLLDRLEKAATK